MKNILMHDNKGFTILELAVVCTIIGILAWIGTSAYSKYREKALVAQSIAEIQIIEKTIVDLAIDNNAYPDSLEEVGLSGFLDPWGNPYQYRNETVDDVVGIELFSFGPDGLGETDDDLWPQIGF